MTSSDSRGITTTTAFDRYLRWNRALSAFFFSPAKDGVPVYLDLEDATLAQLLVEVGGGAASARTSFIDDVRATLPKPSSTRRLLDLHIERLREWVRGDQHEPPPCLAVLGFFSLVAESMVRDQKFSSNNYYGRLCEFLDATDNAAVSAVKTDFAEQSHVLWNVLNAWLHEKGGRLGLPTAYAFDHRVHVGIPISQALVREHDRQRLTALFASADLQPGQRLSVPDMVAVLQEYLPKSLASPNLKRLWKNKAARDQIAEVACRELASWQGGEESSEAETREARISLAALLRTTPVPGLELDLVVARTGRTDLGTYSLAADSSEQARVALQRCGFRLTLKASRLFLNCSAFAESRDISLPDILLGNLSIERGRTRLVRQMRTVIPLKFDETQGAYFEVPRLELGQRCVVLARTQFAASVERALVAACEEPVKRISGGVPTGWVCCGPATLLRKVDPESTDLNPLAPIGARVQLALGGGFALPQRATWFTRLPPEAGSRSTMRRASTS